jgi:hypothetical protein
MTTTGLRTNHHPLSPVDRAVDAGALLAVTLATLAAALGLFVHGVYRDPREVVEMFRGYDLVTLLLVAPVLIFASIGSWRTSPSFILVRASMFAYLVYNYAFVLFGGEFNDVFLLHAAVFAVALFSLVHTLSNLDVVPLSGSFRGRVSTRMLAGLLAVLGLALAGMWVAGALAFVFTGDVPKEGSQLVLPTAMTHLAYVMDLAILVPSYLLAAVLLWRRAAWGYAFATVLFVSGSLHQVSYMAALAFQARAAIPGSTAFDPIEPFILAVYAIGAVLLLANRPTKRSATD